MREDIRAFYELTKLANCSDDTTADVPENWVKTFYKTYPRFQARKLSATRPDGSLAAQLLERKTRREYVTSPLTLSELSTLVCWATGEKSLPTESGYRRRMYPSAGARYPVELYVIAYDVNELARGLYHFNVKECTLETLWLRDLRAEMSEILGWGVGQLGACVLCLTGVLSRSEVKYGVNAYRYALIEAGHIGQNICLISESMGVGCCPIGGFDNNKLTRLLDTHGSEIPLYLCIVGKV